MSLRTVIFALSLTFLYGCGTSTSSAPASERAAADSNERDGSPVIEPAKLEAVEAAIKAEPKVIDYVYDPHLVFQWTIGVANDGSPRHGYAEYICGLIGDGGLSREGTKVRIVDYKKFMQPGGTAREASLGSVDCGTSEHMTP